MKHSSTFIGMDVHKNSIDIAIAESGRTGQVRHYGKINGTLAALNKAVGKLVGKGDRPHFVYEAGPCGYQIHRYLTARGFDCAVVAPSMIPKQSGNRIKNDRRDSMMLARLHRAGELTAVYVPLAEDEAIRDLSRAREDAKSVEKRSKQPLLASYFAAGSGTQADRRGAKLICAGWPTSRWLILPNKLFCRSTSTPLISALCGCSG